MVFPGAFGFVWGWYNILFLVFVLLIAVAGCCGELVLYCLCVDGFAFVWFVWWVSGGRFCRFWAGFRFGIEVVAYYGGFAWIWLFSLGCWV